MRKKEVQSYGFCDYDGYDHGRSRGQSRYGRRYRGGQSSKEADKSRKQRQDEVEG